MSPLINCQNISKAYGSHNLFEELSISLFQGDRVGLIGPNGAGKSTFLKLLSNIEPPDTGKITRRKDLSVEYVPQYAEFINDTIENILNDAAKEIAGLDKHSQYVRVRTVLGIMGFDNPTQLANTLSGGWQRRLSIAKALLKEPDVLLLDEPTNHLDLETILWLENFLQQKNITFIVTSHDRVFLDNVSNKIWEISHIYPGGLFEVDGAYAEFMEKRAAHLQAQARQEASLRSKLRREEEWLRQTPQARTTKSRSRIQEAAKLQQELAQIKRRNATTKSQVALVHSGRQTKKLITAKNISKSFSSNTLFSDIDIELYRGDRLGIVGENGSGKSTLLKILYGEIESDTGTIQYADDLKIFYFDQHREQLDLSLPLRRGLSPTSDIVNYRGSKIHVNGWCERFMFDKNRLDLPMSQLSGGERARVVIARLMINPADVLLLDEPTNDLDIDTLEMLEEDLDDFPGVVVLVTHDRAMMDRIADKLLITNPDHKSDFFNNTDDWLNWRKEQQSKTVLPKPKPQRKPTQKAKTLSYKEKCELAKMEENVLELESVVEELTLQTEDPDIINNPSELQKVCHQLSEKQKELEALFKRWQYLEDKK